MSQESPRGLDIAIIGGGVCGLVCAIALARQGLSSQVYEAAATFGEIGAGIGIGPNAIQVLRAIGVWDDILTKTDISRRPNMSGWVQFRSGQGDSELIYEYPFGPDEEGMGMHRAGFLDALVHKLDSKFIRCYMNKRCTQVLQPESNTSKLTMCFSDGTESSADVVLGADGIKSAVRGAVTRCDPWQDIAFSNTVCYRALIPSEAIRAAGVRTDLKQRPVSFLGKNKHVLTFAIKGGQTINVVAFVANRNTDAPTVDMSRPDPSSPTVVPVTLQELFSQFDGWGPDVLGLLSCVEKTDKWLINVVYPPLESYANGRIALLGDAAHAMLPHLGAGAGQGLEDALLLAKLLSHPQTTLENVSDVLRVYDSVRRPRAQQVWEGSRRAGDIYEFAGLGDNVQIHDVREQIAGIADFVWHHQVEDDLATAVRNLELLGVFVAQ